METLAAKRQIALYHLRVNPKDRVQGRRELYNAESDTYCAIGLLGEMFGLPVRESQDNRILRNSIYDKVTSELSVNDITIWTRNDRGDTFAQIADYLEEVWEEHGS